MDYSHHHSDDKHHLNGAAARFAVLHPGKGSHHDPPETFETTARACAVMPFARQTLANRLKAFARFNILPFYPGYDLEAYARPMAFSTPEQASLSIDDERWKLEHKAQMNEQGVDRLSKAASDGKTTGHRFERA